MQPVVEQWVSRRWWLFLVLPQLGIALLFVIVPMFRGGSYYLGVLESDPYGYGWLLLLASIPYGIGLLAILRTGRSPSRRAIWVGFAAVAIPLVVAPLAQSHDAFQYVFYAKMQLAHHANPYLVAPSAFAEDPWFRFAGWPDAVSVYGPVWTHLVAGGVALTGQRLVAGLLWVKGLGAIFTAVAIAGSLRIQADEKSGIDPRGTFAAVAFAFCPLVLTAGAHGAHPDILLAACFVWAMVLDQRKRPVLAGLVLVIAVLIKIYAVFPLLVFGYVLLRRRGYRPLALIAGGAVALAAVGYAPYWEGWSTLRGTFDTGLLSSSGLAGTVQDWLEIALAWVLPGSAAEVASLIVRVAGLVAILLTMVHLAKAERTLREPWWAATVLLTTFILVTPWFLPWYVVGLIALSAPLLDRTLATPLLVFSGTCMMTVPGLAGLSRTLVRYGPPLLVWKRLRQQQAND